MKASSSALSLSSADAAEPAARCTPGAAAAPGAVKRVALGVQHAVVHLARKGKHLKLVQMLLVHLIKLPVTGTVLEVCIGKGQGVHGVAARAQADEGVLVSNVAALVAAFEGAPHRKGLVAVFCVRMRAVDIHSSGLLGGNEDAAATFDPLFVAPFPPRAIVLN